MDLRRPAALACLLIALATACGGGNGTTPKIGEPAPSDVKRPKPGRYVLDFTGRSLGIETNQTPGPFRQATITETVRVTDDIVTTSSKNSLSPAVTTTVRNEWREGSIRWLSLTGESAGGRSACRFEPPPILLRMPIKIERYPTQRWKSNVCEGLVRLRVTGSTTLNDATGRRWATWRLDVHRENKAADSSTIEDETQWFAPELGRTIRVEREAAGSFGEQRFRTQTSTVLRSYPK